VALPSGIAVALFAGIVLGVPVAQDARRLPAIVTLGFGEIIRILALSDLLEAVLRRSAGHTVHPQAG